MRAPRESPLGVRKPIAYTMGVELDKFTGLSGDRFTWAGTESRRYRCCSETRSSVTAVVSA
jgi:hypothetical protein